MKIAQIVVAAMVLMSGCGNQEWQTKDISGLMPRLEMHLSGVDGEPLTEQHLQGQVVLLAFGFTSCPDVCPDTLARLTAVRHGLPGSEVNDVSIVFVSVDPVRDDPGRLSDYVRHFDQEAIAATGTEQELKQLVRRYRATYSRGEPHADGSYDVSHSSGVYVFDAGGEARVLFRPEDSIEAMRSDLLRLAME